MAPIDVPPFDRSNVDGFAVRSADLATAGETTPVRMMLNDEVIACGTAPMCPVLSGTATSIATGGPVPRGADAIVMVEHTQPAGPRAIEIRRAASPGQFVSYAGSDIARGEALLRAGTIIGSREIGMLAACGISEVSVARRPRVAIISTGDELVQPGLPLRPAAIYDTNGAIVTAAISEMVAKRRFSAPFPMTKRSSKPRCAMRCFKRYAGALWRHVQGRGRCVPSHHLPARQARHHRPWRRAETGQAAVSCGLRRQAGHHPAGISDLGDVHLPRHDRAGAAPHGGPAAAFGRQGQRQGAGADCLRTRPHRFVMVSLVEGDGWPDRLSHRQGIGRDHVVRAGRRFLAHRRAGRPDAGGHGGRGHAVHAACAGAGSRHRRQPLHRARSRHRAAGARRASCARLRSAASADWRRPNAANAISRRSICSTKRPRPTTCRFLAMASNWCRAGGACRALCSARATRVSKAWREAAVRAALADPACIMVNRNQGAGTRILIDRLLGGRSPTATGISRAA